MEINMIFGYLIAIGIGLSMGIMGSGGSILTLPVFVYLFNIDSSHAVEYSLFSIGITAIVGSVQHIKNKEIDYRTTFLFVVPSLLSIIFTKTWILPQIPQLISIGQLSVNKDQLIMLLFAVVILFAAYVMLFNKEKESPNQDLNNKKFIIVFVAVLVGLLTGIVGAGGGFIIVPAFVILLGKNIKQAISSSLLIIATNSIFGFLSNYKHFEHINWTILIIFTIIILIGLNIGQRIKTNLNPTNLKIGFGYFLASIGISIAFIEVFHLFNL